MTFIQAKHYRSGRKEPISMIVLHSMEWAETSSTAAGCASMFHGDSSPVASAHYCVDATNTIQCVRDEDIAWHVKGGDVNDRAIGIEMAGYAKQTVEDWADLYSERMLERVASLVARLCTQYNIPVVALTPDQIKDGDSGITTHANCTIAFKVSGGHTDPGPNFPMAYFLRKVEAYVVYPE
jgi:N-acetyl-anhydromuramyl-L-alanine amidase AmpD